MIDIFNIVILFFIPANVVLLVLLKYKINETLGNFISVVISYGVGPLLNSLLLYYLIWFFPERNRSFYLVIVALFWLMSFLLAYKKMGHALDLYKKYFNFFFKTFFKNKKSLLFLPIFIIFFILLIQALFYPVIDNDKALYLNQSEAVYQYKNLDWQKEKNVLIRGDDEYKYNSAIRPAIPSFMAFSFFIDKESGNYFIFNFLSAYYYVLLFALFLFVVCKLSVSANKKIFISMFSGTLFFVLSWGLGRMFVYNSKENIIYFFALLGLYLVHLVISNKRRIVGLEVILGIILGINSFVNIHGIIIEFITLLSLFVFSSMKLKSRIIQTFTVFAASLFAGGSEFIYMFNFIFVSTVKNSIEHLSSLFFYNGKSLETTSVINNSDMAHQNLYHIKNFADVYLRGKFQIFTNVGVFGFYFWFFIVLLGSNLKELIKNRIVKIILFFILLYFIVVIDPFNLNSNRYAIVLWGSTKYANLILLLSLIVTSVYAIDLLIKIFALISKYINKAILAILFVLTSIILFRGFFISYLVKILLSVVPVYKEEIFYQNKIEIFYYCIPVFLCLLLISIIFKKYNKTDRSFIIFVFASIFLFVLVPFFITDIGKVPLIKTLSYLDKSLEVKLSNAIYEGDIYKTYFFAKKNLLQGTVLKTDFNEVYTYDDHFRLRKNNYTDINYIIDNDCINKNYIYISGKTCLRKK